MTWLELKQFFYSARQVVLAAGYRDEIEWTHKIASAAYSETDLLRESAWVILCSGFKESVVRARFPYISLCYCDWENAASIARRGAICVAAAKHVFGNDAKLVAILRVAELVRNFGFEGFKSAIDKDPILQLRKLPFIGPITAQHLAKNLGYPFAKNDRHLGRLAKSLEIVDAQGLCELIATISGEVVPVVDTILWRYSVLRSSEFREFAAKWREGLRDGHPPTS